jgi:hypothetical protein
MTPQWHDGGLEKIRLMLPVQAAHTVEVLGKDGDAGARVVELLQRLRLV